MCLGEYFQVLTALLWLYITLYSTLDEIEATIYHHES